MKVFISADIEGITTTTRWEETDSKHASYPKHAEQMTNEVLAVVQGALSAGATQIVIKDAHGPGYNIDPTRMPKEVTLIRGTHGSPDLMVQGVDSSFDAAMFVGYHSAAAHDGNPLAHTISGSHTGITINGRDASEFMIYSLAVARYSVPTVFLAGDKLLCEEYADLHPNLLTVAVKDGRGGSTFCRSTESTLPELRATSEKALTQHLESAAITLPKEFEVTITYNSHVKAEKVSFFPDVKRLASNVVGFTRQDYFEVLRTLLWII